MSSTLQPILLGTRGSGLALAQSTMMRDALRQAHPSLQFELKIIKTAGDEKNRPAVLPDAGVKGLFTREIEVALSAGEVAIAIHSLKDLPTALPTGLILAATPKRADARDVFISRGPKAAELPRGSTVATSSLRRGGQLLALRPDLKLVEIRGNVETRLRKLKENPDWQGTVLAAAGLARLKLNVADWGLVAHPFEVEEMLPSPCQAILGLEARANDQSTLELLQALNDEPTFQAATAERAFAHVLEGGCRTPLAAYAEVKENQLTLRGAIFTEDGRVRFRDQIVGEVREAAVLGKTLAQKAKEVLS